MTLTGRMAERSVNGMTFDTAYLGADSIHPDHGLCTFNEEEAELNRALIRASKRLIVLTDSSKFGNLSLHRICDLEDIDIIISDSALTEDQVSAIESRGPELILADKR
jgi:DeoR family transcriptional regulator of aga operon